MIVYIITHLEMQNQVQSYSAQSTITIHIENKMKLEGPRSRLKYILVHLEK